MSRKSSWEPAIREWAAQQTKPFSVRAVMDAVGGSETPSRHVVPKVLARLGYTPSHRRGNGVNGDVLWWRPAATSEPSDCSEKILAAREALDAAAAALTQSLQEWEESLAARQNPPPPIDTEAVFQAGRQEGRQARQVEIVALIDSQLSALSRGTLPYLKLWALKNTIMGVDQ